MIKEVTDKINNGNLSLIKREEIPEGRTILLGVWKMKRNRDINTRKIKTCKSRLYVDGSRTKKGIHHDKVYSPVVGWTYTRILLILVELEGWKTMQVDYVQVFTQTPI